MDSKIIAVDFDGTLCENQWPEIGEPNIELITYLKERKAAGDKLILWTCRRGELLDNAVDWAAEYGIIFDAVNENLPEIIEYMGGDTRKIFADEYIDDRNRILGTEGNSEELLGRLIDVVEDWLSEEDCDEAIIFGDDYDHLADCFAKVIGIDRIGAEK